MRNSQFSGSSGSFVCMLQWFSCTCLKHVTLDCRFALHFMENISRYFFCCFLLLCFCAIFPKQNKNGGRGVKETEKSKKQTSMTVFLFTCTETMIPAMPITAPNTAKHTHMHSLTLTLVCTPSLIPHNWFQSKGSCLSGLRRGLIARYRIPRKEGKASGGEGLMCFCFFFFFSFHSPFLVFMLYLYGNLVSVSRPWRLFKENICLNLSEVCQTPERQRLDHDSDESSFLGSQTLRIRRLFC